MAHLIKAVKGSFFGTPYWSGKMKVAAIAHVIKPPNDPMWDDVLEGHDAQRDLNKGRVLGSMVPYLLNPSYNPFFSALTLILVPIAGDKLEDKVDFDFVPDQPGSDVGELRIEDQVVLFAADGQHRREALAEAFKQNRKIATEEVPVILLPFESVKRMRQLFSDLNLNAKPASKTQGYAFESRDPIVVLVKRLMQDVALFEDGKRVNQKTNSLAAKSPAVISMNSLVEATTTITAAVLDAPVKKVRDHDDLKLIETKDPTDPAVDDLAGRVGEVWEVIIDAFPQWQDVLSGAKSAGALRDGVKDADGNTLQEGYVSAFGIGWQALALVAAAIYRIEGEDWSEALSRAIGSVDWRKGPHWHGIAMIGDRVNNTGPGIRATAGYVLSEAGYKGSGDVEVESLIQTYKTSLEEIGELDEAA